MRMIFVKGTISSLSNCLAGKAGDEERFCKNFDRSPG